MPDPAEVAAEQTTEQEAIAAPTPLADINDVTEYRERRSKGETGETPEVKPEPKPEAKTEAVTEPDAASEAGKKLAAKRGSLQTRIDELTREKHQTASEAATAKAEAAALKAELAALKAGKPAESKPDAKPAVVEDPNDPRPAEKDYEDYAEFIEARAAWRARQEIKAERARAATDDQATARETARASAMDRGAKAYADFGEKVKAYEDAGGLYSPAAQQVILQHELGAEFAYALVTDPAIAARVNGAESHNAAMLEAGAVLAEIRAAKKAAEKPEPKPKPVSKAPPPVEPVIGETAASTPDPANMNSVTEWRKQRGKFLQAA